MLFTVAENGIVLTVYRDLLRMIFMMNQAKA
jgi:hypothetical protein